MKNLTLVKPMMNKLKRWWYVRAMMRCIKSATFDILTEQISSKTDGLRVIKRFEKVNKIKFDPFNINHRELVIGHGMNESFFRAVELLNVQGDK